MRPGYTGRLSGLDDKIMAFFNLDDMGKHEQVVNRVEISSSYHYKRPYRPRQEEQGRGENTATVGAWAGVPMLELETSAQISGII